LLITIPHLHQIHSSINLAPLNSFPNKPNKPTIKMKASPILLTLLTSSFASAHPQASPAPLATIRLSNGCNNIDVDRPFGIDGVENLVSDDWGSSELEINGDILASSMTFVSSTVKGVKCTLTNNGEIIGSVTNIGVLSGRTADLDGNPGAAILQKVNNGFLTCVPFTG